jgi:energy-converting hydrogenase Eha subunit C
MSALPQLEPVQLRPLGIGEIFDRAVTLYVRNFVLFTIIAAFVVVPMSIAQYFLDVQRGGAWAQILDQIQHPSHAANASAPMVVSPWFFWLVAISVLFTPFMYVAMASALGRIYKGEEADWQAAYAVALRHAGGIVVTVILEAVILLFAAFAGAFALALAFVAAFLLVRTVAPLGVVTIVLTSVLFLAYLIAIMLCYLAIALAFDTIGIEEVSFGSAISSSFARVFNRSELGKATLICLAFVAIEIGLTIVVAVLDGFMAAFLHQPLIETIVQAGVSMVTTGFIGVLIAVYYFDVRVRREGLDMQAAIDQLQAQS